MSSERPHILLVASWYPNEQDPLNGIFVQHHAQAIVLKCQVTVLHVYSDSSILTPQIDITTNQNVTEIRLRYPKVTSNVPFLSGWKKLRAIKSALHQLFEQHNAYFETIDLIHYHVMMPMVYFLDDLQQLTKNAQDKQSNKPIPICITEHSTLFTHLRSEKYGFIENHYIKKALKKSTAVSSVSMILQNSLLKIHPEGSYVQIPNVVNTELFKPLNKVKTEEDKKIIIHISDLKDQHKNISGLIRTTAELKKERSDFEVHIIGGGSERNELEQLAASLGVLNNKVRFLGELKGADLIEKLQRAACLSLFSNYETFGVVLIEALACGIPVVASRHACVEEFVREPAHGKLVEVGNEDQFRQALNEVLNNQDQYDAETMHSYIVSNYSYEAVGSQFQKMYSKVIESSN